MTTVRSNGVVVDTMVISWLFEDRSDLLTDRYRDLISTRPVLLAFQTVMELRYGALRAGWAICASAALSAGLPSWRWSSPTTRWS